LIAWITGAFNKSEPTGPEKQEPVKKRKSKTASLIPPPVNWAALGIRGCDQPDAA
jgi:hypothetical protein